MAQTNVQAFSGDVAISSNLAVDTNTLFVDSVGNKVGIGTTSPDYTLDVQGETGFDGSTTLRILNPSSEYGRNHLHLVGRYEGTNDVFSATDARNAIMFKSQSDLNSAITNRWTIQSFPNGTNNDLGFMADTNNTPKVMFRGSNGYVGIGTTNPGSALDVVGDVAISSNLAVDTNTLFVDSVGNNVGIGTTTPGYKLHIEQGYGVNDNGIFISNSNYGSMQGVNISMINTGAYNYSSYASIQPYSSGVAATTNLALCPTGGKLGIGKTNPGSALDVVGDVAISSNLAVDTNTLFVDSVGNKVGIGTASPSGKLHVNGNAIIGDVGGYGGVSHTDAQLTLGGTHNTGYNLDDEIKLLITGGDNDGGSPYYIMCEDENGYDHFYIKGAATQGGSGTMYFKGNFGIGTESPTAILDVRGTENKTYSAGYYFDSSTGTITMTTRTRYVGIYATGDIMTDALFLASSDRRIKKDIIDVNDSEALDTLRLLKPKTYKYKDTNTRGTESVYGFIAQDVSNVISNSTRLVEETIPNIYELADVSESNVITLNTFNTSDLEANTNTIQIMDINGTTHDATITSVIDEHTIRVAENLNNWSGSVDAYGNVITETTTTTLSVEEYEALESKDGCVPTISGYQSANVMISVEEYEALGDTTGYTEVVENYTRTMTTYPGNKLFVYGQRVTDFHSLNKNAIWTVATAALQEVDRQLQAEKVRNDALEARILALESA